MLGLLAQQLGVEHLVAQEDQGYDLYHAEEVLLPHAHTEHLYYYPSASLNYIARAQSSWLGEGIGGQCELERRGQIITGWEDGK